MKAIILQEVAEENFLSSNVIEDDFDAYDPGTTYTTGDKVIITTGDHSVYESQIDDNTGNNPPDNIEGETPAWKRISSTNKWKAVDLRSRSATVSADKIEMEFTFSSLVNALGLINIDATEAQITVTHSDQGVIYEHEADLVDYQGIDNFYDWFTATPARKSKLVLIDLPAYINTTIKVIISNPYGDAEIGECCFGRQFEIGTYLYGAKVGITDYSTKEKDDDGNPTIDEGPYDDTISYPIKVKTARINNIKKTLAAYRAKPMLFVGHTAHGESEIFGFYTDLDIVVRGNLNSKCSLDVEELS